MVLPSVCWELIVIIWEAEIVSQGYVGTPGKSGSWEFELYLYILEMEDLKFVSTYFGLKLKTTMTYLYSNLSKAL